MAKLEVKIPKVGESVREAYLAQWYKKNGDTVQKNAPILSLETDKISLEIKAELAGKLHILVEEGKTVPIGSVVAWIDSVASEEEPKVAPPSEMKKEKTLADSEPKEKPSVSPAAAQKSDSSPAPVSPAIPQQERLMGPKVQDMIEKTGIDPSKIVASGPGGRITQGDVLLYLEQQGGEVLLEAHHKVLPKLKTDKQEESPVLNFPNKPTNMSAIEEIVRKPMTPIRKKIAEKMLEGKNKTAMLTTFNEADMTKVIQIRKEKKDSFQKQHGVSLGFMSFFIKAVIEALKEYPQINAFLDGTDAVYHQYYHIGVAVGSERGLIVPVIRHADQLSFAQIEQTIAYYVQKIKENRLELADLQGGTFTVSNGGVYGSLLSTPILNVPQSGILGMHAIQERPVALEGQVVIRPMMYLAFSYDHRMIDGRESVQFLKRVKECIENPEKLGGV